MSSEKTEETSIIELSESSGKPSAVPPEVRKRNKKWLEEGEAKLEEWEAKAALLRAEDESFESFHTFEQFIVGIRVIIACVIFASVILQFWTTYSESDREIHLLAAYVVAAAILWLFIAEARLYRNRRTQIESLHRNYHHAVAEVDHAVEEVHSYRAVVEHDEGILSHE